MAVEIREIEIRADINDVPPAGGAQDFDVAAFRREILEACERKLEYLLRRTRER